jgi:glycosyltransferase involved in cell wall biosynthesis
MAPKLSVCIPAYNRPAELCNLLESIAAQGPGDWDVVVSEDCSPAAAEISRRVAAFAEAHKNLQIRYSVNPRNLGYDGNLRCLLEKADGEYVVFMGDDDVLAPGALVRVAAALLDSRPGFLLRAWKSVQLKDLTEIETHRYFEGDRDFEPGITSIAALYRRSVFISGLAFKRDLARRFHTDRFDGTLLYQLHLVGRVLLEAPARYIDSVVAIRRVGGVHFFGSSESERGRFTPKQLLPSHSEAFVRGLLGIAQVLDADVCPGAYRLIRRDVARYSYPLLEAQASRVDAREFRQYAGALAKLGLGDDPAFWLYYLLLAAMGPERSNQVVRMTKRFLGRTPVLSGGQGVRRR